jgi:fructose-bisphosphate aldolase class 1
MAYDTVGGIIAFESGELDQDETIELFSHLVKSGLAWSLQGSYGRAAHSLIARGILDQQGNILACETCD